MADHIKALHFKTSIKRHTLVPYLWRASCHCGWWALASNESTAQHALDHHINEEEPFPDLGLDAEPGSEADRRKKDG